MYLPLDYEQLSVLKTLLRCEMRSTTDEILKLSDSQNQNSLRQMRIEKRQAYMGQLIRLYHHISIFEKLD